MARGRKTLDDFSNLTPDHFRRDPTDPDAEAIDPDIALVADWYARALTPEQARELRLRLRSDDVFWDKVAPALVALSLPAPGSDRDRAAPEIIWAGEAQTWTSEDVRRAFILACQTLAEALRKHPATAGFAAKMRRRMFG